MIEAFIATSWIGCGDDFPEEIEGDIAEGRASQQDYPDKGPFRPNLPDYIGSMSEDPTGHVMGSIARDLGYPTPNIVVVRVREKRRKHAGSLERLRYDPCGVILAWNKSGPWESVVGKMGVRDVLKRMGMGESLAADLAEVQGPELVSATVMEVKEFDRRGLVVKVPEEKL